MNTISATSPSTPRPPGRTARPARPRPAEAPAGLTSTLFIVACLVISPCTHERAGTAHGSPSGGAPASTATEAPATPDSAESPQPRPEDGGSAVPANTRPLRDPRAEEAFTRGLAYLESGRVDSALALLRTAIHSAPADERAYRAIVRIHDRQGTLWEGARTFELLGLRFPDQPAPHAFLGEIELLRQRPEPALHEFEKALRIDQRHLASLSGIARSRALLGQQAHALTYFDRLLRARPHDPAYRYGRGVALALAGEPKAAVTQFKWAIQMDPERWLPERDYGRLLAEGGERLELAVTHLERAVDLLLAAGDPATAAEIEAELAAVRLRQTKTPPAGDGG